MWQRSGPVFERHLRIGLLALALLGTAGTAPAAPAGRQVHVVYEGQRLGSIAKRYNVSIEALCRANGIQRRAPIHPGQRLEIPSRAEASGKLEVEPSATAKSGSASETTIKAASDERPAKSAESKAPKVAKDDTKGGAPVLTAAVSPVPTSNPKANSNQTAPSKAGLKSATEEKSALSKVGAERPAATTTPATATPSLVGPLATGLSHKVQAGDSLISIAKRHDTTVKTLLQINNLKRDQVIRVGQVLVLPRPAASAWWGKFARAPQRTGEIEVFAQTHRWKGKVIVNGKVQANARAALSRLLGATGGAPPVPERLIQLLSHVSDVFGGRPVRLVSGYRTNSYFKDSRHRHSSAIDFSIPGVPNSAIRDYMLQLGNVGVGYYPNSSFVHLDVRARSAYWVDYAGPGEAPRKQPGDTRLATNAGKGKRKAAPFVRPRRGFVSNRPTTRQLAALAEQPVRDLQNEPTAALTNAPASAAPTETGDATSSAQPMPARALAEPSAAAPVPGPPAAAASPSIPSAPLTRTAAPASPPRSTTDHATTERATTQSAPLTQAAPSTRANRGS